jgi:hypothetical protein
MGPRLLEKAHVMVCLRNVMIFLILFHYYYNVGYIRFAALYHFEKWVRSARCRRTLYDLIYFLFFCKPICVWIIIIIKSKREMYEFIKKAKKVIYIVWHVKFPHIVN